MKYLFLILISILSLTSCQQGAGGGEKASVNPMTPTEYTYLGEELTKNESADLKDGFSKEQILMKSYAEKYKNDAANYKMVAHKVSRTGEAAPIGIIIEMEVDRIFSSLVGQGKRNKKLYFFAVPSAGSSEKMHNRYHKELQQLGYKDYEVYVSFLSRVLSEMAL